MVGLISADGWRSALFVTVTG